MEDRYTRIEDYLDNVLTESERASFEQDCLADPALASDLALVRDIREQMSQQLARAPQEADLRADLRRLGKQHFSEAPVSVKKRVPLWWTALAAVFVGLLVWVFWPAQRKDLYAEFKNFPKASFTERSAAGAEPAKAEQLFNAREYEQAATVLQKLLLEDPNDAQWRLYLALCQLETGRWDDCRNNLKSLAAPGQPYKDEADWFLALSYLKAGEKATCAQLLNNIEPGSRFYDKARSLQQALPAGQ